MISLIPADYLLFGIQKTDIIKLMKKIVFLFLLIIFIFGGYLIYLKTKKSTSTIPFTLEGKKYRLLIAKDPISWQKGLMFYKNKKELKGADGMIFIFPDKDYRTFWNQNTFLDLDVYWLSDNQVVGKAFLPSITKTKTPITISSNKKVNQVIEIVKNVDNSDDK